MGEPETGDAVVRARELVLAEQFAPAVRLLREHLAAHPDDSIAWHRLAGALIGLQDRDAAMNAATRAIDIDPRNGVAYRYRGIALQARGRFSASLADSQRAVDLLPDDESLSLHAVNVFLVHRDKAESSRLLERAREFNPDSRAVWHVARMLRKALRSEKYVAACLVGLPIAIVLGSAWSTRGYGLSADAQWLLWPGLLAALPLVAWLADRSALGALMGVSWLRVAISAAIAGIVVCVAMFGGVQDLSVAAKSAGIAVLISVFLGVVVKRTRQVFERRARS